MTSSPAEKSNPEQTDKKSKKIGQKKLFAFLGTAFVIILFGNLIVVSYFTITVNKKLDEALESSKPLIGSLILLAPENCPECKSLDSLQKKITAQNIELKTDKTLVANTDEAQKLIAKFEIKKLPALIFETEEDIEDSLRKALEKGAHAASDSKIMVWEQTAPPFFDLNEQKIVGLVSAIFLTDKSCEECYDVVETQKSAISRFNVKLGEERMVDIAEAEGKELVKRYSITKVPTVIFSKEAKNYAELLPIWKQVGSIEEDGSFVFRKVEVFKPAKYRDLEDGKIKGEE